MAATRTEIHEWFLRGRADGHAFMLVVVDEFDYGNYPVYVVGRNCDEVIRETNRRSMQKVMEVYDLQGDPTTQVNEHRAWHTTHADQWEQEPVDVSLEVAGLLDILEETSDG